MEQAVHKPFVLTQQGQAERSLILVFKLMNQEPASSEEYPSKSFPLMRLFICFLFRNAWLQVLSHAGWFHRMYFAARYLEFYPWLHIMGISSCVPAELPFHQFSPMEAHKNLSSTRETMCFPRVCSCTRWQVGISSNTFLNLIKQMKQMLPST